MSGGATLPAASNGFGGWLFQSISQFTQEVLEDLQQTPASERSTSDAKVDDRLLHEPLQAPSTLQQVPDASGEELDTSLLPFAPWKGLTHLTFDAKGLVEKATELTCGMTKEVVHSSMDLLQRAGNLTCEATKTVVTDSAALAATVGETTAQLRQRAVEAAADLLRDSQAIMLEASVVAQEISDSLCKVSGDAFGLDAETGNAPPPDTAEWQKPAPPTATSNKAAREESWLPVTGLTEVFKGSKDAVTAGALGTIALTKEVLRESVDATKGVMDLSSQSLGAKVQSLDWLAHDMFSDALPDDSPVKLQGLLGVHHLDAERFEQAKAEVVNFLWRTRPAFRTAGDICLGTCMAEAGGVGVDIDAVQDSTGHTLRHHLLLAAEAEVPSLQFNAEEVAFRWINPREWQGIDYGPYRAARAALPEEGVLYAAAQRRVEAMVRSAAEPLTLAAIRAGTAQPVAEEAVGPAVGAFLDRFGVDLEEEWALRLELQRGSQQPGKGGLTYTPRAGTFAWTATPFSVELSEDYDGDSDDNAVQAVLQALAAHDRQALQGNDPHLGLLVQNVRPSKVTGRLGQQLDVLVVEQRTGRRVTECGPGTILYSRCPVLAQCGAALADLWRDTLPGPSPPTLHAVELSAADEARPPAGPLARIAPMLLMQVWVRAWHRDVEALVVDAIGGRGGMWKTRLLEFLQLRQLSAVEALGQAGVLQNCGGRWELATDAVLLRLKELCDALDAPGLARLQGLLDTAAAAATACPLASP